MWGAATAVLGARGGSTALLRSGRRAMLAECAVAAVALFSLAVAFARPDFNVALVSEHASRGLHPAQRVLASATGPAGAVLWIFCLFAPAAAALARGSAVRARTMTIVVSLLAVVLALVLITWFRPFARLSFTPPDGSGRDPGLQHPGGLVELALLLSGWASCALAVALAATRRLDRRAGDPAATRWAVLVSWAVLSVALAVRTWRWYAVLDARPGTGPGLVDGFLILTWLGMGTWFFQIAPRRATRILTGAGGILAVLWYASLLLANSTEVQLKPGAAATVPGGMGAPVTVTHLSVSRFEVASGIVSAGTAELVRGSGPARTMVAERRGYFNGVGRALGEAVRPAVSLGLTGDVRLSLMAATPRDGDATYGLLRTAPAWLGLLGLMMILSALGLSAIRAPVSRSDA